MSKANEPAFPLAENFAAPDAMPMWSISYGLTKREYFAALAMQGLCTQYSEYRDPQCSTEIVKFSVKVADALLAELSKEKE